MKRYSAFPPSSSITGASPSDCLVSYQDTRWGSHTPLQRCSQCILLPQLTVQYNRIFSSENCKQMSVRLPSNLGLRHGFWNVKTSFGGLWRLYFSGVMVIVDTATRVQILDETDCISRSTNTLAKGINPIILPPAMDK